MYNIFEYSSITASLVPVFFFLIFYYFFSFLLIGCRFVETDNILESALGTLLTKKEKLLLRIESLN